MEFVDEGVAGVAPTDARKLRHRHQCMQKNIPKA